MISVYNSISQALGGEIIYGTPTTDTADTVVSLSMGDSAESRAYLGGSKCLSYPTVNVTVYSKEYIDGFTRFEAVKAKLSEGVAGTKILHKQDKSSYYDKDLKKHVFTAQYKILN